MRNRAEVFCGILLLMSGIASLALGADKNTGVDQEVGGMGQGRRIQAPGTYSTKPGSAVSSIADRHTITQESEKGTTADMQGKNISGGGNRGFLYQAGHDQPNSSSTAGPRPNQLGKKVSL